MQFLRKHLGYLIVLSVLGMLLYAPNLRNPLFWDDADWILHNPSVHEMSWENIKFIFTHDALGGIGQVSNYYRPFLFLTFLVNFIISQASPVSYHLASNAIHVANGLLIFYLLSRWLNSKRAAFLGALLFTIHPLQTEAVAYISGRGDPLSVLFILGGMVSFVHFRAIARPRQAYLWAGMAMLSRETSVLFPGYMGVALMAFHYRTRFLDRFKKAFIDVLPFVAIGAVYGLLRLTILNFQNTLNFYTQSNIYSENILYRVYTFFHALLVYIRLTVFPTGLHMERDLAINTSLWHGWAWLGLLIILGLLILLAYLYRKETTKRVNEKALKIENFAEKVPVRSRESLWKFKIGKPVSGFQVWFFGLGVFFLNLLPTSGIVPINARIYEHWLYFSLLGAFTIVAWHLDRALSYVEMKKAWLKPTIIIGLVAYCGFLSVQTIRRNLIWGDTEAFYLDILQYQPENVRVLNNLGNWYSERGNDESAAELYVRAVNSDPGQPAPYHNLGNIARDRGNLSEAEALYKKAIAADPAFHYAYRNLARLYASQKRLAEALSVLESLQRIYPSVEIGNAIKALREEME